jgi:imidazolonepropionase-like amidohydrolase
VDPAAEVHELGDRTLLPGFIDSHVHCAGLWRPVRVGGEVQGSPRQVIFRGAGDGTGQSAEVAAALGAVAPLRNLLWSGVTVARDLGAPGSVGFDVRAAVNDNVLAGPRLLVAGRIICPTGGHMHHLGVEADGADGARQATRQMFKEGADFIKVTASGGGGTVGTPMGRPTFTVEELRAVAEESGQRGSYATAHCHSTEAIARCLDAGIPMVEHATFFDADQRVRFDETVALRLRDQGVVVSPTLAVHARRLERFAETPDDVDPVEREYRAWVADGFQRRMEIVARLHELGVPLIIGSDAPARGVAHDDFAYGLVLHVRAGVPAMAAIRSATSTAAKALGIAHATGSLVPGLDADVIAADGDPLADITCVQRVAFVLRRGVVVRSRETEPATRPGP